MCHQQPVTLISAGVGLTPMLSMLHTLSTHQANINWLHAAEHGGVHAFKDEVNQVGNQLSHYQQAIWYRTPRAEDVQNKDYQFKGLMILKQVEDWLAIPDMQFYFVVHYLLCNLLLSSLLNWVLIAKNFIMNVFGPHAVITQDLQ